MRKRCRAGLTALLIFFCLSAGYFMCKSALWAYDEYAYWKIKGELDGRTP